MLKSLAYSVQMSSDIPDVERRIAEKAGESFESMISQIKLLLEYLNYIYIPFSKVQTVDEDEVVENRDILRKYRDNVRAKLEALVKTASDSVVLMSEFSTDSSVEELMNSFVVQINEVEKQGNYLLSIFENLNSPEFKNLLIQSIENIKKQGSVLKQLINDRILEHIDTNILAKNWESLVNEKFQDKVKSKVPLVVRLYEERQKALGK